MYTFLPNIKIQIYYLYIICILLIILCIVLAVSIIICTSCQPTYCTPVWEKNLNINLTKYVYLIFYLFTIYAMLLQCFLCFFRGLSDSGQFYLSRRRVLQLNMLICNQTTLSSSVVWFALQQWYCYCYFRYCFCIFLKNCNALLSIADLHKLTL